MRCFVGVCGLLFLFALHCLSVEGAWSAWRGDSQRTGFAKEVEGPLTPEHLCTRPWNGGFSPTISDENVLYLPGSETRNGFLVHYMYALNGSTLETIWSFQVRAAVAGSPTLDETLKTLSFGDMSGKLYCLDLDGAELWTFEALDSFVFSQPAINEAGTIFISSIDSFLYALHPNGTLAWRSLLPSPGLGLVAVGHQNVYVCSTAKDLALAFDQQTGEMVWNYTFTTPGALGVWGPTVDDEERVFVYGTVFNGTTGKVLFTVPDGLSKGVGWMSLSGPNSYLLSNQGIYSFNYSGTPAWKGDYPVGTSLDTYPATVDGSGSAYVLMSVEHGRLSGWAIYCLLDDIKIWSYGFPGGMFPSGGLGTQLSLGPFGTLYFASFGKLFAFFLDRDLMGC